MPTSDFSKNIEVELKYRLKNEADLQLFERELQKISKEISPVLEQTNYFIDNKQLLLRENRMLCRIRKENKQYFLTLKAPKLKTKNSNTNTNHLDDKEYCSIRTEEEWLIKPSLAQEFIKLENNPIQWAATNKQNPLALLMLEKLAASSELFLIGSFTNIRTQYHIYFLEHSTDQKIIIELDRSHFSDTVKGYEIECECQNQVQLLAAEQFIQTQLKTLKLEVQASKSKSTIFFSLLQKQAS